MNQHNTLPRICLSTLKASAMLFAVITFGVAAHAAPAESEKRPDRPSFAARMDHRLDELQQQLALDKNQQAQWQSARATSEQLHREMMEAHRASREKIKAALNEPSPDLRALAAQIDKERDAQSQKHKQAREAWLKFYDGLNTTQKEKASHFILAMLTRMEKFGPGRHEGMRHDHGHKAPPAPAVQ